MLKQLNTYFKFDCWWIPKIAPGVFTYLLFAYLGSSGTTIQFKGNVLLLFSLLFILAIFGHFINDYSDYEADLKANKNNIFQKIQLKHATLLLTIIILSSFSIAYWINWKVFILVGLQVLLNILYSIKPFRFKERGWLAVLITGFYERTIPYLMIIFSVIIEWNVDLIIFSVIYLLWAYLWECRNYINGQLKDYENDIKSSSRTFIIQKGKEIVIKEKKNLLIVETLGLLVWIAILIQLKQETIYFLILIIAIPFIHETIQRRTLIFKNKENFLDFLYQYAMPHSLIILIFIILDIEQWYLALTMLILLRSDYPLATTKRILTLSIYIFYKIRFLLSKIVNYSIYYYRKLFLRKKI